MQWRRMASAEPFCLIIGSVQIVLHPCFLRQPHTRQMYLRPANVVGQSDAMHVIFLRVLCDKTLDHTESSIVL